MDEELPFAKAEPSFDEDDGDLGDLEKDRPSTSATSRGSEVSGEEFWKIGGGYVSRKMGAGPMRMWSTRD